MSRDPEEFDGGLVDADYIASTSATPEENIKSFTSVERSLQAGTRYVARVRSYSNLGVASEWSEAVEFTTDRDSTVPMAPTDLTAVDEGGNLFITWTAPTLNTDGSVFTDFSHYKITLYDFDQTFVVTSNTPTYTLLYSYNRVLHGNTGAALIWLVSVSAVDYSGNESEAAVTVDSIELTESSPIDFPNTFMSDNWDGGTIEGATPGTTGWRIQSNGLAQYNNLNLTGALRADNVFIANEVAPSPPLGTQNISIGGINPTLPPIAVYVREADVSVANNAIQSIGMDAQKFRNKMDWILDHGHIPDWYGEYLLSYSDPTFTINIDGWYRITLTHCWAIDNVGGRNVYININSGSDLHVGGHQAQPYHQSRFTDSVIVELSAGDTVVPRVLQTSGGILDLTRLLVTIEWLSY